MLLIGSLILLVFLALSYCIGLLERKFNDSTITIYKDHGQYTKPLKDNVNLIKAKPDWILKTKGTNTLFEYKSRARRVYDSDIAQTIASVLAARGAGFRIDKAVIQTANSEHPLRLGDDASLLKRIHEPLETARLVARGGVPKANPINYKCRSCGFKTKCEFAILK